MKGSLTRKVLERSGSLERIVVKRTSKLLESKIDLKYDLSFGILWSRERSNDVKPIKLLWL